MGTQQVEQLAKSAELELNVFERRFDEDVALLDPRLATLEQALVDLVVTSTRTVANMSNANQTQSRDTAALVE
jgi:hypothetical protein